MPRLRTGLVLPLLAALPLPLGGCQMNERLSGTAMGATGGAVLGGVTGGGVGGVLVGGVAGGLAGYLIGDYMADQRERQCGAPAPCSTCPSGSATDSGSPSRAAARAAYARGQRAATSDEARTAYRDAVTADPTYPEAWNALGLNALYAGDHAEADRCFRQALAADPTFFPARQNLALAQGR